MNKNYNMSQIAQLSAKKDNEIKVEIGEGMEITVNTCLSLEEKVSLIEDVVKTSVYGLEPYFNPLKLKIYAALRVLEASTDIEIIKTGEENIYEIYDILNYSGVIDKVLPHTDYQEIVNWAYESAEAFKIYQNSIMGALDEIKDKFDAEEIQNLLGTLAADVQDNPEIMNLLNLYTQENMPESN